jgi:Skp family chaperone for outer membrane proteins
MLDNQDSEQMLFDERIIPIVQNIELQKEHEIQIKEKFDQVNCELHDIQIEVLNLQKEIQENEKNEIKFLLQEIAKLSTFA